MSQQLIKPACESCGESAYVYGDGHSECGRCYVNRLKEQRNK